MAITEVKINNAAVADDYAGYAPIVVSGETDRWPFDSGVRQSEDIDEFSDATGKIMLEIDEMGDFWKEGDTVLISGVQAAASQFEGRHTVETVLAPGGTGAGYLTLETDYPSDYATPITAESGSVVSRMNDSLCVKIEVHDKTNTEVVGEKLARVTAGGVFQADVNRIIQQVFSSLFTLTAGEGNTDGAVREIELKFSEVYQKPDYTLETDYDDSADEDFYAHRTTRLTSTTTELQNTVFTAGDKLLIHFMGTNFAQDYRVIFTYYGKDGGELDIETVTITTNNRYHGMAVSEIDSDAASAKVQVQRFDTELSPQAWVQDKTPLFLPVAPQCIGNKRLYYLNRLGGYASIEFPERERATQATKVDRYAVESHEHWILTSVKEARDRAAYFGDLVDALEIYDESGEPVELLDNRINSYQNDTFDIQVEVRDEQLYIS